MRPIVACVIGYMNFLTGLGNCHFYFWAYQHDGGVGLWLVDSHSSIIVKGFMVFRGLDVHLDIAGWSTFCSYVER